MPQFFAESGVTLEQAVILALVEVLGTLDMVDIVDILDLKVCDLPRYRTL